MSNSKTLSVVIPCFNEENYIGNCVLSLLSNGFPASQMEILIVDGMSKDGTRGIVNELNKSNSQIK